MVTRAEKAALARLQVLVAGNRDLLLILVPFLQELGVVNILRATEGRHAAEHMAQNQGRIDLVLCDGDTDGIDFYQLLEQMGDRGRRAYFIVLSGDVSFDAIKKARASGIDGYIAKPFNTAALRERVLRIAVHAGEQRGTTDTMVPPRTSVGDAQDEGAWLI